MYPLHSHFRSEKQAGLLFLAIGAAALLLLAIAWNMDLGALWSGLAPPVAFISLIQLTTGAFLYLRSDAQLGRLQELYRQDRQAFMAQEGKRLSRVNRNFRTYRTIELCLFFLGLFVFFMGTMGQWGDFSTGLGMGLAIQTAILLVLDLFAGWRSDLYEAQVRRADQWDQW
ncbi:MAG: hypothetical protein AAFV25_14995 [Bacteroidota bacterium]